MIFKKYLHFTLLNIITKECFARRCRSDGDPFKGILSLHIYIHIYLYVFIYIISLRYFICTSDKYIYVYIYISINIFIFFKESHQQHPVSDPKVHSDLQRSEEKVADLYKEIKELSLKSIDLNMIITTLRYLVFVLLCM
jgi:hypothetical protein